MASSQVVSNVITLRGSTEIVTEFFAYSINSILYQRGIYEPSCFTQVKKYGLPLLVTEDEGLKEYLTKVLSQISQWLMKGEVNKLVLVIQSLEEQPLERWTFNIETDKNVADGSSGVEKSQKEIQNEIQALMKQITASVSFLPVLDEECTFDLLVYTDVESRVPTEWVESDPKYMSNAQEVKLRSFTTKIHKVEPMVAYRIDDDE
mmetsp:Transcript_28761/g.32893  ORF Transcript_28761/g.32893 Transcript_28761/m.32893 type:complete len:205 (+) Transcript_28761:26-640(+)